MSTIFKHIGNLWKKYLIPLSAIVCENCGIEIDRCRTICSQCYLTYETFTRNCECKELVINNQCEHCSYSMIGEEAFKTFEKAMAKIEEEGEISLKEMQKRQIYEFDNYDLSLLTIDQLKRFEQMLVLSKTDYDLLELRVEIEFFQDLFKKRNN